VPKVLQRWARDLPAERVHLVTLPARGTGRAELWQRFAQVIEVDPGVADPAHPLIRRNRSLGQREAQLLRRVNVLLEDRLEWPQYGEVMAHLGEHVLGQRHDPILLPQEHRGWVARCSVEMVEALRGSGHPVIGDLDELLVDPVAPVGARHPDASDDAELLEVAVELLATSLFLRPVPPPEPPPLPRFVEAGQRLLWTAHARASRTRGALRWP
jgi:hypothetical protein